MGLQRFPIKNFQGGLNTRDSLLELQPNEGPQVANVQLLERGSIKKRRGARVFETAGGIGAPVYVNNLTVWYPLTGGLGRTLFLNLSNGSLYKTNASGAMSVVTPGTAGKIWGIASDAALGTPPGTPDDERVWVANGVDAPFSLNSNGTAFAWANTPPNGSILRAWKNRMIISGVTAFPQRLFFSTRGDAQDPPASYGANWIDIKSTEDDYEEIMALEILGDLLIVFKRNSVWAVYDQETFDNRRIGSPGCVGRYQTCVLEGRAYFWAKNGLWSTDGQTTPSFEGAHIENYYETWGMTGKKFDQVRVCAYNRRVFVSLPMNNKNDQILEFYPHLRQQRADGVVAGSWVTHDLGARGMTQFRIELPSGDEYEALIAGGLSTHESPESEHLHIIFDESPGSTTFTDDGVPIEGLYRVPPVSVISDEPFERLRRLNVLMEGTATVTVGKEFQELTGSDGPVQRFTLTSDPGHITLQRCRPESRARYHQVQFSHDGTTDPGFTIHQAEMAIRGGKEHT